MIQSLYQEGREGSIMSFSNVPALFFLLLFILRSPIVEGSEKSNSAVSYTLCENFTWAEDTGLFILEVRSNSTPDQKYTVIFGQDGNRTKFLTGKIEQNDVKFLKYESRHEICFQSLVVDTTIIIDQPTFLNESCDGDDNRPCKEWASEIHPVPVCPEALTKLLKDKGDLRSPPSQIHGPNEFEPPVYDTTNDMFQASFDIAEGTSELFRKVVKHKWKALDEAKKVKFSDIGKKLGSFNSFIGAFGPMFSIFSGITSIITTFLTPNPFDELAKYLQMEFKEIHRRLSHIQNDIADLKRVVESQGVMAGMAGKLEAIRYSLRGYERMVNKLSEGKVCGADSLFNRTEVRHFMEQYKEDRVDNSLLDLFGVEFGEVLESPSLLKALMRAYCNTNRGKVEQFMEGVIDYAVAGSLAHFAYQSLECSKEGGQDCDGDEKENEEWKRKLYRFLKKANALKEAVKDPGYGFQLDIQEDVDKLIYAEVAKNPVQLDQLFDKVFDFIMKKLNDINDWPEACIYNLNDKVVIVDLAELKHNATTYKSTMKPWYLDFWGTGNALRKYRFKVKLANDELHTKQKLSGGEKYYCLRPYAIKKDPRSRTTHWEADCEVQFYDKPASHDWIISILFNPNSYKIKAKDKEDDQVTPTVFVKRLPLYVYYTTDEVIREKLRHRAYLEITKAKFWSQSADAAFIEPRIFKQRNTYEPAG